MHVYLTTEYGLVIETSFLFLPILLSKKEATLGSFYK